MMNTFNKVFKRFVSYVGKTQKSDLTPTYQAATESAVERVGKEVRPSDLSTAPEKPLLMPA